MARDAAACLAALAQGLPLPKLGRATDIDTDDVSRDVSGYVSHDVSGDVSDSGCGEDNMVVDDKAAAAALDVHASEADAHSHVPAHADDANSVLSVGQICTMGELLLEALQRLKHTGQSV